MHTTLQEKHTYRDFLEKAVSDKRDGDFLRGIRQTAHERFKAMGLPTKKSEAWKYINLDLLLNSDFGFGAQRPSSHSLDEKLLRPYFLTDSTHERMVFVDGHFSEPLSSIAKHHNGVLIHHLKGNVPSSSKELIQSHFSSRLKEET